MCHAEDIFTCKSIIIFKISTWIPSVFSPPSQIHDCKIVKLLPIPHHIKAIGFGIMLISFTQVLGRTFANPRCASISKYQQNIRWQGNARKGFESVLMVGLSTTGECGRKMFQYYFYLTSYFIHNSKKDSNSM